jgi:hypothetical protein
MSSPALSLNYRYDLPGRSLLEHIKRIAKDSFQMVGTTLESSAAVITFLADQSTISFHLASSQLLTVRAPSKRHGDAMKICRRLVGKGFLTPVRETLSSPNKAHKDFVPAKAVLAAHMAKPEFTEHIVVLPEAIEQAATCEFEHDGTLDRYLAGLVAFAKLKADSANDLKPDDFLATQAGLSHFGVDLGERAKIRYASDYTATYKGASRLFPLHVTLGHGLNPRTCMSIYFDWDPEARKLILARFGRHGRGA